MSTRSSMQQGIAGVITGASSGIGKALALLLAEKYAARLVITARTRDALEITKQEVEKRGGKCLTICGDIGEDLGITKQLVETCLREYGSVDLLVNNAGIGKPGGLTKLTPADWERVFRVNFFAPLYAVYEVMPHFLQKKSGKIVNVSSVASKIAFPGSVCYAASKFALTGLSEGLAAELGPSGIDTITVCPGWVRTEFFEKNAMADIKNPTRIAEKNDLKGMVMRHLLSTSSEQTAKDILAALEKGGSREIITTIPGVFAERMKALFPDLTAMLTSRTPPDYK
jgi:short-subunit dehydrogenase